MPVTETNDDEDDELCHVCAGGGLLHNGVSVMPCPHCGATGVEP